MSALRDFYVDLGLRRICFICLFSFLFLFNAYFSYSIAAETKQPPIRIAYIPNEDVFHNTRNAREYLQELVTILKPYLKNSVELIPAKVPEYSQSAMFNSDKFHITSLVAKSPGRMFQYKFSKLPTVRTDVYLATSARSDINFNDTIGMHGKSVALYAINTQAMDLLDIFLVENNIRMEYKLYNDFDAYVNSDADFHVMNAFYFIHGKTVAARIGEQELFFATIPKYEPLLNLLDQALEQAQKYDAALLEKLQHEHLHQSTQYMRLAKGQEQQKMLDEPSKVPNIGYLPQHYPLQYLDDEGKPAGITFEVLKLFQQMHDNPSRYTAYTPSPNQDIGQFDMLFSIIGDKEKRKQLFYRSVPYAQLPMVLFQQKHGSSATRIKKFGMLDYAELNVDKITQNFPHWNVTQYTSLEEMFAAYENNSIGAMLLSEVEAKFAITKLGIWGNELVPTPYLLPLHLYLSKNFPPEALEVLNTLIDKINPVTVHKIIMNADNFVRKQETIQGFIDKYLAEILIGLTLLIFFGIVFYAAKYAQKDANFIPYLM